MVGGAADGWPQVFCSAQGLSWRLLFARASQEAWEGGTRSRSPLEVSFGLGLEPVMCRPGTRGGLAWVSGCHGRVLFSVSRTEACSPCGHGAGLQQAGAILDQVALEAEPESGFSSRCPEKVGGQRGVAGTWARLAHHLPAPPPELRSTSEPQSRAHPEAGSCCLDWSRPRPGSITGCDMGRTVVRTFEVWGPCRERGGGCQRRDRL